MAHPLSPTTRDGAWLQSRQMSPGVPLQPMLRVVFSTVQPVVKKCASIRCGSVATLPFSRSREVLKNEVAKDRMPQR